MHFIKTCLEDVYLIELSSHEDDRGCFIRTFCQQGLKSHDIEFHVAQSNLAINKNKNTLRGLHYQISPYEEAKLVHCFQGACFDVVVDLRKKSDTFCQWYTVEMHAKNNHALYIPPGCAHGYLTLEDNTSLYYHMSNNYNAEAAYGIHWQSPILAIPWPVRHVHISKRDKLWPDFDPQNFSMNNGIDNNRSSDQ